jgi:hypothetical protein
MGYPYDDRQEAMAPLGSTSYMFSLVAPGGGRCTRLVYWDELYAALWRGRTALAAVRFVPRADEVFAMYVALKYGGESVHRQLLPQLPPGGSGPGLVQLVGEIMPSQEPALPATIRAEGAAALGVALEQTLRQHGPLLVGVFPPEGVASVEYLAEQSRPRTAPPFAALSLDPEDTARVNASFEIHRVLTEAMRAICTQQIAPTGGRGAALLRREFAADLERRLYRDPRYVRLVQWVMEAPGAIVSPLVRDFLKFCYRGLRRRVEELASLGEFDAMFWRERFRSLLGHVEADVLRTLPCYEVTVLGHVCEGELPVHAAGPGRTARTYRVNPNVDLRRVLLDPVKSKRERLALRLLTSMHLHGTVTAVTYLE